LEFIRKDEEPFAEVIGVLGYPYPGANLHFRAQRKAVIAPWELAEISQIAFHPPEHLIRP
jgi:hypothetical protein